MRLSPFRTSAALFLLLMRPFTILADIRVQRPSSLTGLLRFAFSIAMHVYGTRSGLDFTANCATAPMNSEPKVRTVPAVSYNAAAAAV